MEPLVGRSVHGAKDAPRSPARPATSTICSAGDAVRRDGPKPRPRGRIRGIDFEPDIPWDEFTIVTARRHSRRQLRRADRSTISRTSPTTSSITPKSRSCCWPIPIGCCVEEARRRSHHDRRRCPPVFSRSTTRSPRGRSIWGADNIFKRYRRVSAATWTRRSRRRRTSSKANTRRARRSSSTSSRTA